MKPGLRPLIIGIVILIAACILPFLFLIPLFKDDSLNVQFAVPGEFEVLIEEPGRYHLWHDYQTIFEGTTVRNDPSLPNGLTISIENPDGTPFDLQRNANTNVQIMGTAKQSIGSIEVTAPTTVRVSVAGEPTGHVFSFGESRIGSIVFTAIATVLSAGLLAVGGLIFTILGIVRLVNGKLPTSHRRSAI